MLVRLFTLCAVFGFALSLSGCGTPTKSGSGVPANAVAEGSTDEPRSAADIDKEARELLAAKDEVAEARAWLTGDRHMLWKGDPPTIRKLIDDIYAAGAPTVQAVGIGSLGENDKEKVWICAMFVAELPKSGEARAKVFAVENAFWKAMEAGEYATKDVGQSYLIINLDL